MERDWAAEFDRVFEGPVSRVQARVWTEVLGDEYPAELDPFSFVTWSQLQRFSSELGVGDGDTLVDVGCGRGGPGRWVAAATGARLVGVDISTAALAAARERAASLGMAESSEFREGSFERTGLDDGAADAVMSIDSLLFSVDKPAAAAELRRVIRPGGRLVLTSWDYHRQPEGRPPQVDDHRPLLAAAGFEVLSYDETSDWYEFQSRTTAELLAAVDELAAESGEPPAKVRADILEMAATDEVMSRRVLVVARVRS